MSILPEQSAEINPELANEINPELDARLSALALGNLKDGALEQETLWQDRFTQERPGRSHLIDQLLDSLHGVLPENVGKHLNDLFFAAQQYLGGEAKEKPALLKELIGQTKNMDASRIARALALDATVAGAAQYVHLGQELATPKQQFEQMFKQLFEGKKDKASRAATLEKLKAVKEQLLISMVYTMHPTVFHSKAARELEEKIRTTIDGGQVTQSTDKADMAAENAINAATDPNDIQNFIHSDGALKSVSESDSPLTSFLKIFNEGKGDKILDGVEKLTAIAKVNVGQETALEREFHTAIRAQLNDVIRAWNNAVVQVLGEKKYGFSIGEVTPLKFSDEEKQRIFEFRTWGRSADADGREKATSIELGKAIVQARENPEEKLKLDLRQNAAVHRRLISALTQKEYRFSKRHPIESGLFNMCEDFKNAQKKDGSSSFDPARDTFEDLLADKQTEFLKQLIDNNVSLVPQALMQELEKDVLDFRNEFMPAFNKFRETHAQEIKQVFPGVSLENITLTDLNQIYSDNKAERNMRLTLEDIFRREFKEQYKIEVRDDGLAYQRDTVGGTAEFLQGTKRPVAGNGHEIIPVEERSTLIDVVKRMLLVKDELKQNKTIADRYQIANFESAADFYSLFKLMQETGLITVENKKVTDVKLGIQPLFETEEDLKKAPEIFAQLLEDPLVRSYYEKRGQVDIMVGFSDGSKSAGNFASQWAIYKATQALAQQIEASGLTSKDGKPLQVRLLQGRGRGLDRGGTLEPALESMLLPPEITHRAVSDVTIQSDLPMQMMLSPKYGQHLLANKIVGTLRGAMEGAARLVNQDAQVEQYKDDIEEIATKASQIFNEKVRLDPAGLAFLNKLPENKERSSRSPKRAGGGKKSHQEEWDATRAITIEYGFNTVDLPAHQVGFATALREYAAKHGTERLQQMYQEHPFFKAMCDVASVGIQNHDPVIAMKYAEKMGDAEKQFVQGVNQELADLPKLLQQIRGKEPEHAAALKSGRVAHTGKMSQASELDVIAHALLLSDHVPQWRPDMRKDPQADELIKNLIYVVGREVANRGTSVSLEQTASRAGASLAL